MPRQDHEKDKENVETETLNMTEITVSSRVLVWGAGPVACKAALELAELGYEVLLCSPGREISGDPHLWAGGDQPGRDGEDLVGDVQGHSSIQVIAPCGILALEGPPGRFRITLERDGARFVEEVGAVVLASEPVLVPEFDAWGLEESERIRSLSWLEEVISSGNRVGASFPEEGGNVVFLCGFTHHSNPFSQERAVRAAMTLASGDRCQVLFLTEHFKVAHVGMERLTRQARETGVLFVKMTDAGPTVKHDGDRITVEYYDESLGMEVSIHPQLAVLEESYRPGRDTTLVAERLGVHLDPQGFFQGDNVYNQPIATNRVGILVAGPAKGVVSREEGLEEAAAAVLHVHTLLDKGKQVVAENRIVLDKKKCTICMTCYRLCPHRAISYLNRRPVFSDLACRACGICAAECPMDAIQIHGFTDTQVKADLGGISLQRQRETDGAPLLVAFCCQNSALEAAELAGRRGLPLPSAINMVKVPCAGRVDVDYLLSAFRLGADGVMVLGCHHGSCKSVQGSDLAEYRVEVMKEALEEAGIERERLFFGGLSSGSSAEFARMTRAMEEAVRNLGHSPVRPMKSRGAGK